MDPRDPERDEHAADVRCVDCATEYRPVAGAAVACPVCACPTWVSVRIPGPFRPNLGSA